MLLFVLRRHCYQLYVYCFFDFAVFIATEQYALSVTHNFTTCFAHSCPFFVAYDETNSLVPLSQRPINASLFPLCYDTNYCRDTDAPPSSYLFNKTALFDLDPDLVSRCSLTRHFSSWQEELKHDPDRDFLLDGIAHGFHIVDELSLVRSSDSQNYASALTEITKPKLDALFKEEILQGQLTIQECKPHRVQAIGAVEKKGTDKVRPITDCSMPEDNSLNSYIEIEKFTFQSIDDAVKLSSPDCFYAIVDLKSAYRHVPV